jgi:hypothetical protein
MLACLRSRVGVIIPAYFFAAAAAGFVISVGIGLAAAFSSELTDLAALAMAALLLLLINAFTIPYTFLLAALPAAAIITFAELRDIRSPWFYAAMGVCAAAAVVLGVAVAILLTNGGKATDWTATAVSLGGIILVFAVPGVVGGLTYWAKAGRDAGCMARNWGAGPKGAKQDDVSAIARFEAVFAKTDMTA